MPVAAPREERTNLAQRAVGARVMPPPHTDDRIRHPFAKRREFGLRRPRHDTCGLGFAVGRLPVSRHGLRDAG